MILLLIQVGGREIAIEAANFAGNPERKQGQQADKGKQSVALLQGIGRDRGSAELLVGLASVPGLRLLEAVEQSVDQTLFLWLHLSPSLWCADCAFSHPKLTGHQWYLINSSMIEGLPGSSGAPDGGTDRGCRFVAELVWCDVRHLGAVSVNAR